jgi:hypothetical protein
MTSPREKESDMDYIKYRLRVFHRNAIDALIGFAFVFGAFCLGCLMFRVVGLGWGILVMSVGAIVVVLFQESPHDKINRPRPREYDSTLRPLKREW